MLDQVRLAQSGRTFYPQEPVLERVRLVTENDAGQGACSAYAEGELIAGALVNEVSVLSPDTRPAEPLAQVVLLQRQASWAAAGHTLQPNRGRRVRPRPRRVLDPRRRHTHPPLLPDQDHHQVMTMRRGLQQALGERAQRPRRPELTRPPSLLVLDDDLFDGRSSSRRAHVSRTSERCREVRVGRPVRRCSCARSILAVSSRRKPSTNEPPDYL